MFRPSQPRASPTAAYRRRPAPRAPAPRLRRRGRPVGRAGGHVWLLGASAGYRLTALPGPPGASTVPPAAWSWPPKGYPRARISSAPNSGRKGRGSLPAPLALPLVGISGDGVIDLGADGLAMICRASSVSFSLRTPVEQEALVAGFGRYLNSLGEPAQVVIRAEPIDLGPVIAELERGAPALPHPGLEEAARAHARFLAELGRTRCLRTRWSWIDLTGSLLAGTGRGPDGGGHAGALRTKLAPEFRRGRQASGLPPGSGALGAHHCVPGAVDDRRFARLGAAGFIRLGPIHLTCGLVRIPL